MNLPTLRQLQYLVAVVEERHFGRAAGRCFVTQSTLSAGIHELENGLGTRLLERSKRKVLPMPLGEEMARRAQRIIALTGELVETACHDDTPLCGPLRLGVIPTIGPFLLPRVLPEIRRRFPRLELSLIEEPTERLLAQLEAGTLDTVILAFPYGVGGRVHEIFWREDFLVALPKAHPLADRKAIAPEMLPRRELLLLADGHCLTDHTLAACKFKDMKSSEVFQGTSLYTLLQMVAGGQGITLIPEMAIANEWLGGGEIQLVPLAEPGPHREIGLVWRETSFRQADMKLLAQTMGEVFRGPADNAKKLEK